MADVSRYANKVVKLCFGAELKLYDIKVFCQNSAVQYECFSFTL